MAGQYSGLQQRIKDINPLADFSPCVAHSLNLVGVCAAECTHWAVQFFDFVQKVYNFFSASTHRWNVLVSSLPTKAILLKSLSVTRWSARADATNALFSSYSAIQNALLGISNDNSQKPATRNEASGIAKQFGHLEIALMATLWQKILEWFNQTNEALQKADIDLGTALQLYDSLSAYLETLRSQELFNECESEAMLLSYDEYKASRQHKRKQQFDESAEPDSEETLSSGDHFRINTFYVIR